MYPPPIGANNVNRIFQQAAQAEEEVVAEEALLFQRARGTLRYFDQTHQEEDESDADRFTNPWSGCIGRNAQSTLSVHYSYTIGTL
jgi:hypothetical protein